MGKGEARRAEEQSVTDFLARRGQEVHQNERIRHNRAASTAAGREVLFREQLVEQLERVFAGKLASPLVRQPKAKGKVERILNLLLSDTHYGSSLDPREVGHAYGPVEEARRTAAICREAAQYKEHYRGETKLYVHLVGDLIQGQLHDQRDGLPLAEQAAACIRILVQAIRYLAVHFPRGVEVFCTPGNHGRNTARHRERAVLQKWDSIETIIYVALQQAVANLPNVQVRLTYEPKYDFDMLGSMGMGTHGDTVLNPGFPGDSVNTKALLRQVNSINAARAAKGLKPYSLFVMGHVHTGALVRLPGGITIITNGCLIPPDAYAQSIGILDTANGQWLWESVAGHAVGDARFVDVDVHTDADASLDQIIKPFSGL